MITAKEMSKIVSTYRQKKLTELQEKIMTNFELVKDDVWQYIVDAGDAGLSSISLPKDKFPISLLGSFREFLEPNGFSVSIQEYDTGITIRWPQEPIQVPKNISPLDAARAAGI